MEKACTIKYIHEDGFDWVEIPDELWAVVWFLDYYEGIPLYVKHGYN